MTCLVTDIVTTDDEEERPEGNLPRTRRPVGPVTLFAPRPKKQVKCL